MTKMLFFTNHSDFFPYDLTLQLPSALQWFIAYLTSLDFLACSFTSGSLSLLSSVLFLVAADKFFWWKDDYTLQAQHEIPDGHTEQWLLNLLKHLTAIEPDFIQELMEFKSSVNGKLILNRNTMFTQCDFAGRVNE